MTVYAAGVQWETREKTAERLRIRTNTLDVWRHRGHIESYTDLDGTIWVDYDAAADRERAARQRRHAA